MLRPDQLRAMLDDMLRDFGVSVTLVRPAGGTFDTAEEETTQATRALIEDFKSTSDSLDGAEMKVWSDTTTARVPADGINLGDPAEPKTNDYLRIKGKDWRITKVWPDYSPGGEGEVLSYRLELEY